MRAVKEATTAPGASLSDGYWCCKRSNYSARSVTEWWTCALYKKQLLLLLLMSLLSSDINDYVDVVSVFLWMDLHIGVGDCFHFCALQYKKETTFNTNLKERYRIGKKRKSWRSQIYIKLTQSNEDDSRKHPLKHFCLKLHSV